MRVAAEPVATSLDDLDRAGWWSVAGTRVHVTNLDKVLVPGPPPLTKRDVIRYYAEVGPWLLPYLRNRPVNANRYPDGVGRPGFWHKEVPDHAPDWLTRWHNTEADEDETQCYAVLDSVPALVWMANFAGVELHPWTSRLPDVHQPTWALVDIDPGDSTTFGDVLDLARLFRTALAHLGVTGMPKVTGKRGVQIWIPVRDGYSFDDTRSWVEKVSRVVGRIRPRAARLHAERDQQDARGAVQHPPRPARARVGADHVGGAGRPGPPAGPLDRAHGAGAAAGGGGSAGPARRGAAGAAGAVGQRAAAFTRRV
jgi:bifunctional non-homologous end joining protein LigD